MRITTDRQYEFKSPDDAHWMLVAYSELERDSCYVSPSLELYRMNYAKYKDVLNGMDHLGMITRTINGIVTEMHLFAKSGTYQGVHQNEPS